MSPSDAERGFTLVELMVAMALATLLVGAAFKLFWELSATDQQLEQSLSGSLDFSVIESRLRSDFRRVSASLCGSPAKWQLNLAGANSGLENTLRFGLRTYAPGEAAPGTTRAAGTVAFDLIQALPVTVEVVSQLTPSAALNLNAPSAFAEGDFAAYCTPISAQVWPVSSAAGTQLGHDLRPAADFSPCSASFYSESGCAGVPVCIGALPSGYAGSCAASVALRGSLRRLEGIRWYIADNGRGGRSIFRTRLRVGAMTPIQPVEIAEGIDKLEINPDMLLGPPPILRSVHLLVNDRAMQLRTGYQ